MAFRSVSHIFLLVLLRFLACFSEVLWGTFEVTGTGSARSTVFFRVLTVLRYQGCKGNWGMLRRLRALVVLGRTEAAPIPRKGLPWGSGLL